MMRTKAILPPGKPILVSLSHEHLDSLDRLCVKRQIARTQIIREAIEAHLATATDGRRERPSGWICLAEPNV